MRQALELARLAFESGEVPVGCVIARGGLVVGKGFNRRETDRSALAHAEIIAIHSACEALGGWRLHECDAYVTLEPCSMCAGAMINARIKNVYFGASDPKSGCVGSKINLFECEFNHKPNYSGGIMAEECADLLKKFFSGLREKRHEDLIQL